MGTDTDEGLYEGDWWNPSRDAICVPSSLTATGNSPLWVNPGRRSFSIVVGTEPQKLERLKNDSHLALAWTECGLPGRQSEVIASSGYETIWRAGSIDFRS